MLCGFRLKLPAVWTIVFLTATALGQIENGSKILLREKWSLQSSAKVPQTGEVISSSAYRPQDWYPIQVPTTVVAALTANKVYPDPHFGMNLRTYPGMGYQIGQNFSNLAMPPDSPFAVPWWYRTEFTAPLAKPDQRFWLHFEGINFRANVWLNGQKIAGSDTMAGASRLFQWDVTQAIHPGENNTLAVEVSAPNPKDLAITFVDWNPAPPDKMMGIFRDVSLRVTGPVVMQHPFVQTELELPSLTKAHLTVMADLANASNKEVRGILRGTIGSIRLEQTVTLAAGQRQTVRFQPTDYPRLVVSNPRLWWPVQLGPQNLHDLKLEYLIDKTTSDRQAIRFGIRQITGEFNSGGHLGFKVNGKSVLIRGAGYTPEMLLRSNPERKEAEIRYVKAMNLNTIRMEGKIEDDHFLDYCDQQGILVLAGWCCCDHWEKWPTWEEEDYLVAAESLKDQIHRIRRHAGLLAWMNGSDGPPPAKVEKIYLQILKELSWPNPIVSSATGKKAEFSGPSGVKMNGPYDYVPPVYWYVDKTKGGAFGFNTETGPGPAVPPLESLKRMFPPDKLWPINEYWTFHSGGGPFKSLAIFTNALDQRYGTAKGVEDYARKAQAMAYESHRAMLEAFGRNKHQATGVIQWMLNNAWPSLIWHLYDFYLRPGGSYFGAKKACEPLHIQYSYDDRSVVVVTSTPESYRDMRAQATVYNFDLTEKFTRTEWFHADPDGTQRILTIPTLEGLSKTYFLKLTLGKKTGKAVSHNFYWLSTIEDQLDDPKSTWYHTPQKAFADFTALQELPSPEVELSQRNMVQGPEQTTRVSIRNSSSRLAFFLRLMLKKGAGGEEVLPVLWEDNYITLMPGEQREIQATCRIKDLEGQKPVVEVARE